MQALKRYDQADRASDHQEESRFSPPPFTRPVFFICSPIPCLTPRHFALLEPLDMPFQHSVDS